MDLLFSKYASPFLLVEGYISTQRFSLFVSEFFEITNEEKAWDYYLHKVFDKSFDDFKKQMNAKTEPVEIERIETTISNSKNLINNFVPEK